MMALEWPQDNVDFFCAKWQITPKSVVGSDRNWNSYKFSCMCLLPSRMKKIRRKINSLEWPQHFSHLYVYGNFSICLRAAKSAALGPFNPEFCPDFMVVLVT